MNYENRYYVGSREVSTEVYRCLLMFGICFFHANINGNWNHVWLANIMRACVTGFCLISGYYGIKLRWKKFAYLWYVSLFCAITVTAIYDWWWQDKPFFCLESLKMIRIRMFSHWFLNDYAALMLLSPLLNKAIDTIERVDFLSVVLPPGI